MLRLKVKNTAASFRMGIKLFFFRSQKTKGTVKYFAVPFILHYEDSYSILLLIPLLPGIFE